jgi:hypothetical protein
LSGDVDRKLQAICQSRRGKKTPATKPTTPAKGKSHQPQLCGKNSRNLTARHSDICPMSHEKLPNQGRFVTPGQSISKIQGRSA